MADNNYTSGATSTASAAADAFSSDSTRTTEQKLKASVSVLNSNLKSTGTALSAISSDFGKVTSAFRVLGTNMSSALSSFGDLADEGDLTSVAGDAAIGYLNSKWERLKTGITTMVPVSVESLVGTVAPYTMKLEDIGTNLKDRLSKLISYITGVEVNWDSESGALSNIGGIAGSLGSDVEAYMRANPEYSSMVSCIDTVRSFVTVFDSVVSVVDLIKKLKTTIESVAPTIRIFSELASVWSTGGASGAEAATDISEEVQKGSSILEQLALYAIKKLVFPLTINLPALLVGVMETMSVRTAMLDLPEGYEWLSNLFDDEYFNDVEYSLAWGESIYNSLKTMHDDLVSLGEDSVIRGEEMVKRFKTIWTSEHMTSIRALARKTACLPDYSSMAWNTRGSVKSLASGTSYNDTTGSGDALTDILNDDSENNPVTSVESVMKISGLLYDNML